MTMRYIKTLTVKNKTFEIVKDDRGYWAIEDKYFTNGKLNKEVNGITGHLRDTLKGCIETATISAEIDYLINVENWDPTDAIEEVILGKDQ